MRDLVRLIDDETTVDVFADGGGDAIRVMFGPEPHGITFVGNLEDVHRLFDEVDRQVSGHAARR